MMKRIRLENYTKNVILLVALAHSFPQIEEFLQASAAGRDKGMAGTLLLAVSIVAVTACFANFAFTYERVAAQVFWQRMLAHVTTALLMFLIGIALEMSAVLSNMIIGRFFYLEFCWVALYIASVLFDFWDLERIGIKKKEIKETTPQGPDQPG